MTFHPILVHFPIALLTLYAILEIVSWGKIKRLPYLFYVKAVTLIAGTLISFLTYYTGSIQEELFSGSMHNLVETHGTFALLSVILFSFLSLIYLMAWVHRTTQGVLWMKFSLWRFLSVIEGFIFSKRLEVLLAIVGLGFITITGALGGAIVYGPDVDPAVSSIYHLFVR